MGAKENERQRRKAPKAITSKKTQYLSINGRKSTTKHTQIGHLSGTKRGKKIPQKLAQKENQLTGQLSALGAQTPQKMLHASPISPRSPLNSISLVHCAPGNPTRRCLDIREGFICLGTSQLLGAGVVVSEVLRESAEDVLWPLLVSPSSHEWEEQLDEEPEDKSSLINRTGVKNSANVAPKLNRSS